MARQLASSSPSAEDLAVWIEPVPEGNDLAPFSVVDAWEVNALFDALIRRAQLLSIYVAEGGRCHGNLIAQDPDAGELQIRILELEDMPAVGSQLTCVTDLLGIKVQFSCPLQVPPVTGGDVLRVLRPVSVARLQRRRFLRIEAPLGLPFSASLVMAGRGLELGIDNLSLGGVALRASPREARLLYVGQRLPRVTLELGRDAVLQTDLEVRSRRAWSSFLLGEQYLIGCSFASLSEEARDILCSTLDAMVS